MPQFLSIFSITLETWIESHNKMQNVKRSMKKGTGNNGAMLPSGTHCWALRVVFCHWVPHMPTCLQVVHPIPTSFLDSAASLLQSLISLVHSFIHSFVHLLTQPMSTCWRPGIEPCMGTRCFLPFPMPPGLFLETALSSPSYSFPWRDLSPLVSESEVRVIPSDKVSPRLKLPVSSYLHQSISTCLGILMAYGSRRKLQMREN